MRRVLTDRLKRGPAIPDLRGVPPDDLIEMSSARISLGASAFAALGAQYIADAWINEVKWLGMTITPSHAAEPQCNGVIERFMRTLKEQCVWDGEKRPIKSIKTCPV